MDQFVIPIIVIFVIATVVITVSATQSNHLNNSLTRLASRYNGTLTPSSFLKKPSLRFVHRDARALLDYYSTGGKNKTYYTQIKLYGPVPRQRVEIYPEGIWSNLGKLIGISDVKIGSPRFDDDYVIKGNSGAVLRPILNEQVQIGINALRHLVGNGDIYVSINHGVLHIRKRSMIRDYSTLNRFIELSTALYDALTAVEQEGIEFVGQAEIEEAWTEAICQVCGEVIQDDVVLCSKCETAHHQECWQYYGACSTYGCREKKFRYPQNAS